MSFWFEPCRTPHTEEQGDIGAWEPDLHPTDLPFLREHLQSWANGYSGSSNWGTKSDGYVLGHLLGKDFKMYINKWAPPNAVIAWGDRLVEMAANYLLANNAYFLRYGKFFQALGQRGIGVELSW